MEIGVSREPSDGEGQELAAGTGGMQLLSLRHPLVICGHLPPAGSKVGFLPGKQLFVSLNIPLLFLGKKTPTQTWIAVITRVGQLAELGLFIFINKSCQAMFFQWSHECVSRWGADLPSIAMAEIWAGWSSCGVLCRQPSGDHWGGIIIP